MSEKKRYSAQEMRDAADTMDECLKEMEDGNSMYWRDDHITSEDWKAMLRQGADDGEELDNLRKATSVVPDSDMRLAHYYLSMHRGMLENMRLGYMKRFEDSGREFTNERAKAERCQSDINTVDGWLERHKDHRVDESKVNHLNGDYSTKKVIKF